ncbi:MAG TPA: MarR family transcriptional regulator [Cyclobacteriaceae bacterium]|nr:MarR family transcriptional regulator [Cyclobacteriaceae bacterium]
MNQEKDIHLTSNFGEQQDTIREILQTASVINNLQQKCLKPFHLSVQQYQVLHVLRQTFPDSLTAQELKMKMVDRTPNLTRMVDKLLSQKLLSRIRSNKDRRKVFIRITEKGLDFMAKLDSSQRDFLRLADKLTVDETGQLTSLLLKIRN